MLENIGLMKGISGKMNWLNQRNTVLSQNIANADTPGYRPSDLEKVDFGGVMESSRNRPRINQVKTDGAHIGASTKMGDSKSKVTKDVYEAAPAENSVILEEQLLKAQETMADYNMVTNLYKKNVGMIRLAIQD